MSESGGNTPSSGERTSLQTARRVITFLWLAVCGVQITIWLLMCLISLRLHSPFFLWTVGVGGVVIGGLWWITDPSRRTRDASGHERSE